MLHIHKRSKSYAGMSVTSYYWGKGCSFLNLTPHDAALGKLGNAGVAPGLYIKNTQIE